MVCLHIEDNGTFTGTTLPSSNLDDSLESLSGLRVHGGGPMKPTASPVCPDKRMRTGRCFAIAQQPGR